MSSFSSTTRSLYRIVLFSMVFLLVLTAALSVIARVSLPLMSGYKGSLESRLGQYLGTPVTIGSLSLTWEGVGPVVKAHEVNIIESDDRRVQVDSVLLDINLARSVLSGGPSINELTLVGADLYIEYSGAGEFSVHGVATERGSNDASDTASAVADSNRNDAGLDGLSWLTQARRVGLLETRITLIDMTDGRRLSIRDLNLRAENRGEAHQLRLDLLLPESLGQRVEAGIDFSGSEVNWSDTEGQFYINAEALDMTGWRKLFSDSFKRPAAVQTKSGDTDKAGHSATNWANALNGLDADGSLELWGQWQEGEVTTARGQMALDRLTDVDSQQRLLERVALDLDYRDMNPGWRFVAQELVLENRWRSTYIDELVIQRGSRRSGDWSVAASGDRLALDSLSVLPTALLSSAGHPAGLWLEKASPVGRVSDWVVDIENTGGRPLITAKGHFDDIGWQNSGDWPGLDSLSGRVAIDENQGSALLRGRNMILNAPLDLTAPVMLDRLDATFDVSLANGKAKRHELKGQVAIEEKGISLNSRVTTVLKAGKSPHMDLQGRFSVANVAEVPALLPLGRISPGTARWFRQALEAGRAENGRFILFGHLSDFPFNSKEGVFSAGFDLRDGQLKSLPDWPATSGIDGRVEVNGLTLTGRATKGRMDTLNVSRAVATIADLSRPVLSYESTGKGPLQSMIDFGTTGPLARWLKPALTGVQGTGNVAMDLELRVPLVKSRVSDSPFKVDGSVFMSDNDVRFESANVALTQVRGAIGFSHTGIRINNLRGRFLDQVVTLDGKTVGEGDEASTHIHVAGALDATSVLEHFEVPLGRFVEGSSQWNVTLEAPHDSERAAQQGVRLVATSDLVGTALQLPQPMKKGSVTPERMRLETAIREGRPRSIWRIDYGNRVRALASIRDEALEALSVRFGGEYPDVKLKKGIHIDGTADSLALDGWVESVATLIDDLPESEEPSLIMPVSADLSVDAMIAGVQRLGAARLRASSDDAWLKAEIENQTITGQVTYPREHWRRDVVARAQLSHVDKRLIDALQSAPETEDEPESEGLDPRLLPPLDVNVENLQWDRLQLSEVSLRTQPDVSGLLIETLGFAYRNLQLVGSGEWFLLDPQGVNPALEGEHSTRLSLSLQSDNFGSGLAQVGFPNAVAQGEGRIALELDWPGPAYLPELESMDGSVSMDLRNGRIVALDPGAGRLVGLFALQALPQRLSFDFSDVVDDGLAFQKITGDLTLEDGIADASLVQLSGPVGVVDITGTTNLVDEQYNQRIAVLPRVSAALPVIGLIAGGASAGIGALVAGGFLKALGLDIDRIGLRQYELQGSWDEPELLPVD